MFWFKKKKTASEESAETENILPAEAEENTEALSEETEFSETDEQPASKEFDEEFEELEEFPEEEIQIPDIAVKINSIDELTEFLSSKKAGGIQYMKTETLEVFEIREAHLRLARVWGSVSMSRECTPDEYGRIMLAMEIIDDPSAFLPLPSLDEKKLKELASDFCRQRYSVDEKKYLKNPEKFAQLVKENGDSEDWRAFAKESLYDLAAEFCIDRGIEFDISEESANE